MNLHHPLVRLWRTTLLGVMASSSAAAFATLAPAPGTQLINGAAFSANACANERQRCTFTGTRTVAYGANGKFAIKQVAGPVACDNSTFGDPIKGASKSCYLDIQTLTATRPAVPAIPVTDAAAPAKPPVSEVFAAHQKAMLLWRNDLPVKHPKGSCASCHGADFFDLARIGSTEADIVRRAMTDGATSDEAEALRQAVVNMRKDMKLPATNARTFRPFQPGGSVLLPDLKEAQWNVASVKRDIAFAENVSKLLPTFYGPRIGTLAQAQKARDEMLDIARGTNQAGANPKSTQLRDLPVGLEYPLWSADKFHGAKEGTFNDWVSDLGFIPKPGRKVEWEALQNAYLARPANDTFWPMYAAVDTMLQLATPLGTCTVLERNVSGAINQAVCNRAPQGFEDKLRSAMIGQHMMRMDVLGRRAEFVQGALGFAYLDTQPIAGWKAGTTLPAAPWDVGDVLARGVLSGAVLKTLGPTAASLGLPKFVVDSINAEKEGKTEVTDVQLPWMWIGFTFDPSFARISKSNSTTSSEYLISTLIDRKLFNHLAFMTNMRLLATYLPEQSVATSRNSSTGVTRVPTTRMHGLISYGYSTGYRRNVGGWGYDGWAESLKHGGVGRVPQDLKDQSMALWSTQFGNGMRTTLLLLLDELENRPSGIDKKWLADTAASIKKDGVSAWGQEFREHWAKFHPQHIAADNALADEVAQAIVKAAGI